MELVGSQVCSEMGGAQGLPGFDVVGGSATQGSTSVVEELVRLRRVEKLKYHVGAMKDKDGD